MSAPSRCPAGAVLALDSGLPGARLRGASGCICPPIPEVCVTAVDPDVSLSSAEPTSATGPAGLRDVIGAYVGLTKPRIIELLLLTTVPVMFLAQRGVPPLGLVVATVVGGTLSAGSANALNCVYDADIDERMRRTRRRALPPPGLTRCPRERHNRRLAPPFTVIGDRFLTASQRHAVERPVQLSEPRHTRETHDDRRCRATHHGTATCQDL